MMVDMARQERRFVIVTPHQSVGRPGTEVTASQLNMDDEQLDDWVDAGHGREIHVRTGPPPSSVSKVTRSSASTSSGTSSSASKDDDAASDD